MKSVIKIFLPLSLGIVVGHAETPTFQHVIVIVQENRTPDNLFQGLCAPPYGTAASCSVTPNASQYDIQTANWTNSKSKTGVTQPTPLLLASKADMSHTHSAFVSMCDADPKTGKCRMDGTSGVPCTPAGSCPKNAGYQYVDNSTGIVNPYLTLATQYGFANYMFQTNQGPSFPAHQFLFGGTSAPSAADDAAGIFVAENPNGQVVGNNAGCAAPAGSTVQLIEPNGSEKNTVYPCFEHLTMVDVLPSTFTWRYYASSPGSIWTAPNSIQHICNSTGPGGKCTGPEWTDNVELNAVNILKDITNCNLRSLSWVTPTAANSDHAGVNDGGGPSWVASIVNAIGNAATCEGNAGYWANTAIFIVWDDWGGWYDHEPPTILGKPEGDYQFGFRVPLIVVSPYTPVGFVSNERHDFGSILRFIESNFGIAQGALNFADARGKDNLSEFFSQRDLHEFKIVSAPKDASFFLNDKRPAEDPDDDQ
jgi:phospholipase C